METITPSDENPPQKIPIFDLNFSSFQHMNENTPELDHQGTRIIFLFKADETFYRLSALYHSNTLVRVVDFVNAQRQLRSMMIAEKSRGQGVRS